MTTMKRKDYEKPSDPEPVRGGNSINGWGDGGTTDEDIYM